MAHAENSRRDADGMLDRLRQHGVMRRGRVRLERDGEFQVIHREGIGRVAPAQPELMLQHAGLGFHHTVEHGQVHQHALDLDQAVRP
jgi:hypothetical protein